MIKKLCNKENLSKIKGNNMIKIDNQKLKQIFLEIKENNIKGIETLYNQYNRLVYGIAFSILKNKEDAEDIVQIIFTKIYEMDKSKFPIDKEASWLYQITKNETLNFLKKRKNEISLDKIYEIEDHHSEIDEVIDCIEFNKLLNKLNDKEKEIVSLKILSKFSFQEISKLLNEPVGTVKWRYYTSLRSIRFMLGNFAMFIITLTIGIKATLMDVKTTEEQQEEMQDENINITDKEEGRNSIRQDINNEISQDQQQNNEMQDIIQEENTTKGEIKEQNKNEVNTQNEVNQETIVIEKQPIENNISYVGIGCIGISILFFIFSIIFFIKYQLKTKKKLSK